MIARAAALLFSLAIVAAAFELGVRWLAPQPLVRIHEGVWVPDHRGLGHSLAPELDTLIDTGEGAVQLRTDARGHRITTPSADPKAAKRILALGDSFLEALAVEADRTLSEVLASRLSALRGEPVKVVNTGVSGSGPNRYLAVARQELARSDERYDALLVLLFLGNDVVVRRVDPIPPRDPTPTREWHLPRSLERREWISGLVYPTYTVLRSRSQAVVWLKRRLLPVTIRLGLSDRDFPPVFLRSEQSSARWTRTAEICADIGGEAQRRGLPTLFALLPPDYVVNPEMGLRYARGSGIEPEAFDLDQPARILGDALRSRGLEVLDLSDALRAAREAGQPLYGRVDRHLDASGHAVVANALESGLLRTLGEGSGAAPK